MRAKARPGRKERERQRERERERERESKGHCVRAPKGGYYPNEGRVGEECKAW